MKGNKLETNRKQIDNTFDKLMTDHSDGQRLLLIVIKMLPIHIIIPQ